MDTREMQEEYNKEVQQVKQTPKIGIGSYAYRYNIGFDGFMPPHKMGLMDFIREAAGLHMQGVQLCENLSYAAMDRSLLERARDLLTENDMFVELGMRDVTYENVLQHIGIAERAGSSFIRAVAGKPSQYPETEKEPLKRQLLSVLRQVLPVLKEKGIKLGLENHYDLPTRDLLHVVQMLNDEHIGLVLDTTNALGFIEKPEHTLEMVLPYLLSVHIKDYIVQKVEAGYLVRGTVLGEGLLDYKMLLSKVLTEKPSASLILEMTIRREKQMSKNEILRWEREKVTQSAKVLQDFVCAYRRDQQERGGTDVQSIDN